MTTITVDDILIGDEVLTGAWMVPAYVGDCPVWPLDHDIILV